MFNKMDITSDARLIIQCADSQHRNRLDSLEDFRGYVEYTVSKSKYISDIYLINLEQILCQSIRPQLPDSMVLRNQKTPTIHVLPHPVSNLLLIGQVQAPGYAQCEPTYTAALSDICRFARPFPVLPSLRL
ncbi:hypothetical protein QBC39DRAFT_333674 [Podospora conica]|nr:hypothetical protein QBC39DRAFT_333674 [Schizothecium conicum]